MYNLEVAQQKATTLYRDMFGEYAAAQRTVYWTDINKVLSKLDIEVHMLCFESLQDAYTGVLGLEGIGGNISVEGGIHILGIDMRLPLVDQRYIVAKAIAYHELGIEEGEMFGIKLTTDFDNDRECALVEYVLALLIPDFLVDTLCKQGVGVDAIAQVFDVPNWLVDLKLGQRKRV